MHQTYIDGEHLGIADLVRMDKGFAGFNFDNAWLLTRINIPKKHRGKGFASNLLKRILADADKEAAVIILQISPSDGLQYEELTRWYYRYNFRQHMSGFWFRRPQSNELTMFHAYDGEHVTHVRLCERHSSTYDVHLSLCEGTGICATFMADPEECAECERVEVHQPPTS